MKLSQIFAPGRQWSPARPVAVEPLVWLDPYHQPCSPLELRVYAALADGPLPLSEIIERLAEAEVRAGHASGAWSLSAGAEALPALRDEAYRSLEQLDGRQIAMETPLPIRSIAFNSWQLQLCA